jgi:hypothetical protein
MKNCVKAFTVKKPEELYWEKSDVSNCVQTKRILLEKNHIFLAE